MNIPFVSAIIVAAGNSSRMGRNKLLLPVGGEPLIAKTVAAFEKAASVREIVVVTRSDDVRNTIGNKNFTKRIVFAPGGDCRQESVRNGFLSVSAEAEIICVHDGARPFVLPADIDRVNAAAAEFGAAVCGVRAVNTVKTVSDEGFIDETVDRERVVSVFTPQSFRRGIYREALDRSRHLLPSFTDDSGLVEACGYPVKFVECDRCNIKVTYPSDLK